MGTVIIMATAMTETSVPQAAMINLLRLVSPALPIGAFAYSQGLESAIFEGHIQDREDTEAWLAEVFQRTLGQLDLPVLTRLCEAYANSDYAEVKAWNQFVFASRETFELHKEERDMGNALGRLLRDLGQPNPVTEIKPGYVCQFAWAGYAWEIPAEELKTGYAFAWFENQIAAATKLVPLGQTDAQRALAKLCRLIPDLVNQALADEELNQSLPGLAAMSSRHEAQEARLFRS